MTTILCIDTASPAFAIAFGDDGGVRSLQCEQPQEHTSRLLHAIASLAAGEPFAAIAVVNGPGSYAGLRVGIATAEGLAFARGLLLQGVPTLDAVAAASGLARLTTIHPAGRGNYAFQEYRDGLAAGPLSSCPAAELPTQPVLAGEGAGPLGGIEISPEERCRAALAIARGRGFEGGATLDALYLREPTITLPRRTAPASA